MGAPQKPQCDRVGCNQAHQRRYRHKHNRLNKHPLFWRHKSFIDWMTMTKNGMRKVGQVLFTAYMMEDAWRKQYDS